ncbi:MAG TPA: protein kinase [Verrucomicrobiae bacterium]|nr:protein kinase [Verrucomicrobiae bacterium]
MSIASEPKKCPKCGEVIPLEAPRGLCPKCLLSQASIPTGAGGSEAQNQAGTRRLAEPGLAELASAFPQLELIELIGHGGMGFVYKARQPKLDRFVALKILPQSLAADPAFADRFTREGRLLARLNHPNIVTVHDFGQVNGFFYLLMEYVDGVNLRQAMRAGRFTVDQALAVVPKICDALQFAHNEGVLHRDIKPENILLDQKGRIKIADFGIAKLVGEAQSEPPLTHGSGGLGTPHYMAPEQIERPGAADHRADIYSLGVVFYEMLTGELPLGKFQPPSQKVEVDARLDDLVLHALEKEPGRRYQAASELKTAVTNILEARGTSPATSGPSVARRPKQNSSLKAGAVVFFVTVLVVTAITLLLPKLYLATSRVSVEPVTVDDEAPMVDAESPYLIPNQIQLVRSTILPRVAEELNLSARWSSRDVSMTPQAASERLMSSVVLQPIRNTRSFQIDVTSPSPAEAAGIANAIAGEYATYCSQKVKAAIQTRLSAGKGTLRVRPVKDLLQVEILERATPPAQPSRPNRPLDIWLGILLGFALGAITSSGIALRRFIRSRVSAPPVQGPDRFWRRFAVAVSLIVLAFILVPIIGILVAIVAPALSRSHVLDNISPSTTESMVLTTNFYVGDFSFPRGDSIEISSVERSNGAMRVTGRYNLVSSDRAKLALLITAPGFASGPMDSRQSMAIEKGSGRFDLLYAHVVPGLPHVNMYSATGGHPFAELYFGNKQEAAAEEGFVSHAKP